MLKYVGAVQGSLPTILTKANAVATAVKNRSSATSSFRLHRTKHDQANFLAHLDEVQHPRMLLLLPAMRVHQQARHVLTLHEDDSNQAKVTVHSYMGSMPPNAFAAALQASVPTCTCFTRDDGVILPVVQLERHLFFNSLHMLLQGIQAIDQEVHLQGMLDEMGLQT